MYYPVIGLLATMILLIENYDILLNRNAMNDKTTFGRVLVFLGRAVAGLILLANLVNIFIPIVFTIDENSVYHGMLLRDIMLAIQILLLIMISVHACSAIGKQPKEKKSRTLICPFIPAPTCLAPACFTPLSSIMSGTSTIR